MVLKFLGRGSGFAKDHTSAYFTTTNNEIVIIDCPSIAFQKLKDMDLTSYEKLYILITHTHGDHIGGLGLFVQYVYFVLKKQVTIVAPSADVAEDIKQLLTIEGNETSWYEIINATNVEIVSKPWFFGKILTMHSPQLANKCFGYHLMVDGTNVIYTGDTSVLEPFIPLLVECSELYVDTSVYYGAIHLKLEDTLNDFIAFTKRDIKVYLMHLDDVSSAEKIIESIPNIEVVELV